MKKFKEFATAGFLISAVFSIGMIDIHVSGAETDIYSNEQMDLIQGGMAAISSENYRFEEEREERMSVCFSVGENTDKSKEEKQQEAVIARENNNATLQERKDACAEALYCGMAALDRRIEVAGFALTREEFKEVISAVVNSNPELFYVGTKYSVGVFDLSDKDNTKIVDYCLGFYKYQTENKEPDRDKIGEMIAEVEKKRDEILSAILVPGMNDLEKMLMIHNYIILNTEYDYSNYLTYRQTGDGNVFDDSVYNVYGSLINGVAVCQGYSLAYKYLLEAAGVDNIGFASNDEHIWNTVTLNGENYYVDCTWDDLNWDTLGNVKYKYFMKNKDNLLNHEIKNTDRECSGTAYSNMFWEEVDSGIFYYNGDYYYIGDDGNLYRTRLGFNSDIAAESEKVANLELVKTDSWDYDNGAKLALVGCYILYHDSKNIYTYNLRENKKNLLYSPDLQKNELIYGLSYRDGTFLYATRNEAVSDEGVFYSNTKQNKYNYTLPLELFYVPVQGDEIDTGEDSDNIVDGDREELPDDVQLDDDEKQSTMPAVGEEQSVILPDTGEQGAPPSDIEGQSMIQTGWKTIGNKKYYFDKKGIMQTGWKTIGKKRYYFNKKGVMQTGWKTIGKKRYYFNKKGVMQTGWKTIGKKRYYFSKKGVMQTGWKTIGKKKYYFNKKGVMVKKVM